MRSRLDSTYSGAGGDGNSSDSDEETLLRLDHQTANSMSLFYAYPNPMLKMLSEATSKFVIEVSYCLAKSNFQLINISCNSLL